MSVGNAVRNRQIAQSTFNRGKQAGLTQAAAVPAPAAATTTDATNADFSTLANAVTALYGAGTTPSVTPTPVLVDPTQQDQGGSSSGTTINWAKLGAWALILGGGYLAYRYYRKHFGARKAA
jgi:hypothetical protein